MPTSSEPPEKAGLAAFLAGHTPFQGSTQDELDALAGGASLTRFPAGVVVADYATGVPDEVWMVRDGAVALRTSGDGALIDNVTPGGIFGYMPLLAGAGMDFEARTTAPSTLVRLPEPLVRAQFAKPSGLAFLASSGWNHVAERSMLMPAADSTPVGELVRGEVLVVEPGDAVRDVVVKMTEHHASYALIRLPDGRLGIFTDRDLRARVVAAGVPVDVAIERVMSAPARTVTADLTADSVLMEMLECGLRHMPVLTPRGEVVGVLEDADLLAATARQSFMLRRAIAQAGTADELQVAGRRVTGTAVDLFRSGTKAAATSAILSVVVDSLVRRALELVVAQPQNRNLDGFAWLTLGSVARREAMPSSDVDSALSWRDELGGQAPRLRALAAEVHEVLDASGLPSDRNGAVASKRTFSRSQSDWLHTAQGWLSDPLRDRGLILSSLLIDARVVWGDPSLHTVPAAFQRIREQHPNALRLQLLDALSGKMRTRSLRDVLSRRGGTFDLKNHAVTPVVNLARWAGLTAGVTSASTPTRLQAGAEAGALSERDAQTLCDVFAMLQRLRMTHQVDQVAAGHAPGDIITMSELSPLNRSLLGDGLREIAAVRRRVGNLGLTGV
ncbi:putative nucleotidyltransferase substrate binding domain-containing protein [Mycobacterium sp. ITM-2016-00317]|uniref:putative nucleotidyltransferase substrate binding domain-containing protein n=1 Tax=Mycobacterium sp. ITM-2016-00317 TaxID=2099694 RepID=UPI00287F8402|nr:putative nucleotidyltransferase substrate binding domain-containing protein [Mycobacterium sp. ITM-2016-00317]WNG85526.1 putative nucleotidyltransferase substrate binding domain-containing protein [Mycobacterium sp. ITM-2016-00317]